MQLTSELLYLVATVHMIAILLIFIYFITKLFELENGTIGSQEYCDAVNPFVPVKLAVHGLATFLLYLHGARLMIVLNMPMIAWELYKFVWNWKDGEYNPEELDIADNVAKKRWYHVMATIYFAILTSLYIRRIDETGKYFQDFKPFFQVKAFLLLFTMALIYVIIWLLVRFIQKTAELEYTMLVLSQDDEGVFERKLCKNLNRTLGIKFLVHCLVSSLLFNYHYRVLFLINVPFIIWETIDIAWVDDGTESAPDPQNLKYLSTRGKSAKWHLAFFVAFLYCATFNMLNKRKRRFDISDIVFKYEILTYIHLALMVSPLICIMIFYVCYKFPNILKDRWCCIIINTVFCIHTAIHIHTMIYVLTAGHWIMFIFSFLYTILFEIEALVSEDDCHVGFVGLDDIRQRNEFTRNVQHCLLHIVFFFVLFSCSAYITHYGRQTENFSAEMKESEYLFFTAVAQAIYRLF